MCRRATTRFSRCNKEGEAVITITMSSGVTMMATRRDVMIGAAAAGLSPVMVSGTPGTALSAEGKMVLCMHTNTSAAAGYRGALEGWAKAGIKNVELNATVVDEFLRTDTLDGAPWEGCSSRIPTGSRQLKLSSAVSTCSHRSE